MKNNLNPLLSIIETLRTNHIGFPLSILQNSHAKILMKYVISRTKFTSIPISLTYFTFLLFVKVCPFSHIVNSYFKVQSEPRKSLEQNIKISVILNTFNKKKDLRNKDICSSTKPIQKMSMKLDEIL